MYPHLIVDLLDSLLLSTQEPEPPPFIFNVLEENRKEILTWLDTHFHESQGNYPSIARALKKFPHFKNENAWLDYVDENINPFLEERGLPPVDTTTDFLDPEFVALTNVMVDPSDRRSDAAKLKEYGKTTRWWRAQLRRRRNREYYQKRIDQIFDEDLVSKIKLGVTRLVETDDLNAIKFASEWTGAFAPKDQEIYNLQLLVRLLMEALAKHVTPEILATVAEELDKQAPLALLKGN